MLDLIELGRGKMKDPLVMSWALRRFSLARDRRLMEEAWFGDSTLRHWLEVDDEGVLCRMFDALSAERFSVFEPVIAERLQGWTLGMYERAVSCLLRNSPADLIPMFEEEIARDPVDYDRLEVIASSLDDLPMPSRLELLQSLADLLPDIGNEESGRIILNRLLRPALNLGPDVLSRVLKAASFLQPVEDLWNAIDYFCEALLGDVHLFFDAKNMTGKTESAAFSERRPFFESAAPLEECDRMLAGSISQAAALDLLERHRPQVSDDLRRFLPELVSKHGATERDAACLTVAAVLDAYELREIDAGSVDLEETLRLMTLPVCWNHHFGALAKHLRDFDPDDVAAGARATMESLGAVPSTSRLVWAIGALELVDLVPDLIEWANQDAADSVIDQAEVALAFLGEPAVRAVVEGWGGFDFMQKAMGRGVLKRVGGQSVSDFALERHDEMFGDPDVRRDWCALVEAAPDGRAVDLLARYVHRKQPEIDGTYYTLCVLTGREPENLPEVRKRVLKRRRRATWTRSESSDRVELELACGECGEINTYLVRDIVLSSVEGPGPKHFVREEFPCASCGEFPDFKLTVNGLLALTASVLRYGAEPSRDCPFSQLDVNYRGEKRSVAGVVEELGAALKGDPRSLVNLLRMGRVQRSLGRSARALRFYAKAMKIAPTSMEASLGVAQIAADRGEARKALDLLSRLQENEANWSFLRVDEVSPGALKRDFSSLRRRLSAALGEPPLAEESGRKRRRTGRNEPCPCGSGKKYKKCCMRAGG